MENQKPKVALIVGPRERFSHTRQSLESIYNDTECPFDLVYVDVCTPPPIQRYLEEQRIPTVISIVFLPQDCVSSPCMGLGVVLTWHCFPSQKRS